MRKAVIFGREVAMQGSPWTLVEYRRAFGSDLLRDVMAAYSQTPPDMAAILQVVWAMARTYDEETPGFEEWIRGFDPKEFALEEAEWLGKADGAISAELFRGRKAGARERARRWAARRLGALAKRLVA